MCAESCSCVRALQADRRWHPEGRIILASFATFDVLATYAPNNGCAETQFQSVLGKRLDASHD
eukprot:3176089-Amphidinium_carterae.2